MENIRLFAEKQKTCIKELPDFEPVSGVHLGHRVIPVEAVMAYVPGGNYPLFSTALMLSIPAKVAGVSRVVACSPPVKGKSSIHPKTLVAMDIAGVDEIYTMGGNQTVAAMAYGTENITPVDMIVEPGNSYVTEAKSFDTIMVIASAMIFMKSTSTGLRRTNRFPSGLTNG